MSILNPFLKSPLTDFTGDVISAQWGNGACAKMEMKALDCLEAYGMDRGLKKCSVVIDDFVECLTSRKQMLRIVAMKKERDRQVADGERKKEDHFTKNPPASDIY